MKLRFFVLSVILLFSSVSVTGQEKLESFYGLKLGSKYPEIAVLNALRASGAGRQSPIVKDSLAAFGRLTYTVDGIVLKGSDASEQVKTSATVIMSPDNVFEAVILNPNIPGVDPVTFVADNAVPDIIHFANANTERVEDEFFGLKLGSNVSLVSITKAVGENGSYNSSYSEGKTRVHSFTGVKYADADWDYGIFSVTPAGKLVAFTVYSVFEGRVKGYHPANRLHLRMRDRYFQKYGFSVPYSEDEEVLNDYTFSGQNGIDQIVSFFDTETRQGKDAYCVQMEYVHDALNRGL